MIATSIVSEEQVCKSLIGMDSRDTGRKELVIIRIDK